MKNPDVKYYPLYATLEMTEVGDIKLLILPTDEWILDSVNDEYIVLRQAKHIGAALMQSTMEENPSR